MKLYPGRITAIASEIVQAITEDGDVEVLPESISEVELDVAAVLKEYIRGERDLTDRARETIATRNLPPSQIHKIRNQLAEQRKFGIGDDTIDYITGQIIEMLMHSGHVEEVYSEDHDLRRKMRPVLRRHMEIDTELDQEVRDRIKNLDEGTSTWEIEYQRVMDQLKQNKKL